MARQRTQRGFTLVEVMAAVVILGFVITGLMAIRTGAVEDAADARNWRVAREMASQLLSELRAGAREFPPEWGQEQPIRDMKGFAFVFERDEDRIADLESSIESMSEDEASAKTGELREWQRNRDERRQALHQGITLDEYRQERKQEDYDREMEEANAIPSETEMVDVAVFVFFPNMRQRDGESDRSYFTLKANVSTMAIQGMTPEETSTLAESRGGTAEAAAESGQGEGF